METQNKNDLQPWLDYFDGLQRLVRNGYLEMHPKEHEAYITRAAFLTITTDEDGIVKRKKPKSLREATNMVRNLNLMKDTVGYIRIYAGYLSQEGCDYTTKPFALHIVEEDTPHNMLNTMLLRNCRRWWKPWRKQEKMEIINYTNSKQNGKQTELRHQD